MLILTVALGFFVIILVICEIVRDIKDHNAINKKYEELLNKNDELYNTPLTWSRETGFNRAPTLDEATRFTVNEAGDLNRKAMVENGVLPIESLPSALAKD